MIWVIKWEFIVRTGSLDGLEMWFWFPWVHSNPWMDVMCVQELLRGCLICGQFLSVSPTLNGVDQTMCGKVWVGMKATNTDIVKDHTHSPNLTLISHIHIRRHTHIYRLVTLIIHIYTRDICTWDYVIYKSVRFCVDSHRDNHTRTSTSSISNLHYLWLTLTPSS